MSWGCGRCETVNGDDVSSCAVCGAARGEHPDAPVPAPPTLPRARPSAHPTTPRTDETDPARPAAVRATVRRGVGGTLAGGRRRGGAGAGRARGPGLRSTIGAHPQGDDDAPTATQAEAPATPAPSVPIVPAVPLISRRPAADAPPVSTRSLRTGGGAASSAATAPPTAGGARRSLLVALVVVAVLALVALVVLASL